MNYLISQLIQIEDSDGNPLVGGKIYVYDHNTVNPAQTYSDIEGHLNTNPVILDSLGHCTILVPPEKAYDVIIKNKNDEQQFSIYGVSGLGSSVIEGQAVEIVAGDNITVDKVETPEKITYTISAQAGGGSTYTAGNGILISEDNIISNTAVNPTVGEGTAIWVEGGDNSGTGTAIHVEGGNNTANGLTLHVEGANNSVLGQAVHAEGVYNTINENANVVHAEGSGNTVIEGTGYAHIEGGGNSVGNQWNHVEGGGNNVETGTLETGGGTNHVEGGGNTLVNGGTTHVEGGGNNVTGSTTHVEGGDNTVVGNTIHVEGYYHNVNVPTGEANASHIEGGENTLTCSDSSKKFNHIEGSNNTVTDASYAHVEGNNNTVGGTENHVSGEINIVNGTRCFVHGTRNLVGEAGQETTIIGGNNQTTNSRSLVLGNDNILGAEGGYNIVSGNHNSNTDSQRMSYTFINGSSNDIAGTYNIVTGVRNQIVAADHNLIVGDDVKINGSTYTASENIICGEDIELEGGQKNIIAGIFIGGSETRTPGHLSQSVVVGQQNYFHNGSSWSNIIGGEQNEFDTKDSIVAGTKNLLNVSKGVIVAGTDNAVQSDNGFVVGSNNFILGPNAIALGKGLDISVSTSDDTKVGVGRYNQQGGFNIFEVGNGTDDEHRLTVFNIDADTNRITYYYNGKKYTLEPDDETVLWSGSLPWTSTGTTITLSESIYNFTSLKVYNRPHPSNGNFLQEIPVEEGYMNGVPICCYGYVGGTSAGVRINSCGFEFTETTMHTKNVQQNSISAGEVTTATCPSVLTKIVGCKRKFGK